MENEEKNLIQPETGAAAEETVKEAPAPKAAMLEGIDIDNEVIEATSKMTPAYLNMLQQRMNPDEEEPVTRTMPVPEAPEDTKKKELMLQIHNQETIISSNGKAPFGKKAKVRRAAKKHLAELQAELDKLD